MKYAREKDYEAITSLLSRLSIRYIFHNSDPAIYEAGFPQSPYTYMKTSFPQTQKGYEEFVDKLPTKRIYTNGSYVIYELDRSVWRSELYVTDVLEGAPDSQAQFMATRISPVFYHMSLTTKDTHPNIVVWNNTYNRNWQLFVDNTLVPEDRHVKLNGYANAWRFTTDDLEGKKSYTMTLRLKSQKYIWIGWGVTLISLIVLALMSIRQKTYV